MDAMLRFKLYTIEQGECLLWIGAAQNATGMFSLNGKTVTAARASLLFDGRDPGNRSAIRMCPHKLCVSPNHTTFIGDTRYAEIFSIKFWQQVDKRGKNECWPWVGDRLPGGYGTTRFGGKRDGSHRVAYALIHGQIPKGLYILHSCHNPPCCNPDHLSAGTAADNTNDMIKAKRGNPLFGDLHPHAKLSVAVVQSVKKRILLGETPKNIATELGVHYQTIRRAVRGVDWKHTGPPIDLTGHARGEAHGTAKLSWEKVHSIRKLYADGHASQYELADQFGVSQTCIYRIVNKITWAHVKLPPEGSSNSS